MIGNSRTWAQRIRQGVGAPVQPKQDHRADAETALIALGYKPMQATKAIEQAANTLGADAETEALIRQALKMMVAG